MMQAVYELDGKVFRFSPVVLDGLLGRGAKGADRMRKLAAAINVSVSSLKDWRRGIHSPSGIEKIDDIAAWAGIPRASLLIEIEGETNMSTDPIETEQLTQLQIAALCKLWNSAHDFLDLAEAVDLFVWPDVKLERIPQSIRPELTLEAADAFAETGAVSSCDLLESARESYLREVRRASPVAGSSMLFAELMKFADVIEKLGYGEEGEDWIPDPDILYDPQEEGYISPMDLAILEGRRLLDGIREGLLKAGAA